MQMKRAYVPLMKSVYKHTLSAVLSARKSESKKSGKQLLLWLFEFEWIFRDLSIFIIDVKVLLRFFFLARAIKTQNAERNFV